MFPPLPAPAHPPPATKIRFPASTTATTTTTSSAVVVLATAPPPIAADAQCFCSRTVLELKQSRRRRKENNKETTAKAVVSAAAAPPSGTTTATQKSAAAATAAAPSDSDIATTAAAAAATTVSATTERQPDILGPWLARMRYGGGGSGGSDNIDRLASTIADRRDGSDGESTERQRQVHVPELLRYFYEQCGSAATETGTISGVEFFDYVRIWGLVEPRFEANPNRCEDVAEGRFVRAVERTLPNSAKIALVFHGTSDRNVDAILKRGLDRFKRTGQAYGPGEYFSTEPGLSSSYCRGGKRMLVFAVVLPGDGSGPAPDEKDKKKGAAKSPPKYGPPPHNIVVVENNDHQYPLGVLHFEKATGEALARSQAAAAELQRLSQKLQRAASWASEASLRAKIIQHLIRDELDVASEVYSARKSQLSDASKCEIATFACKKYDPDFVSYYFPGFHKIATSHLSSRVKATTGICNGGDSDHGSVSDEGKGEDMNDKEYPLGCCGNKGKKEKEERQEEDEENEVEEEEEEEEEEEDVQESMFRLAVESTTPTKTVEMLQQELMNTRQEFELAKKKHFT